VQQGETEIKITQTRKHQTNQERENFGKWGFVQTEKNKSEQIETQRKNGGLIQNRSTLSSDSLAAQIASNDSHFLSVTHLSCWPRRMTSGQLSKECKIFRRSVEGSVFKHLPSFHCQTARKYSLSHSTDP
jgi:hypothetical protein